MRRVAWLVAAGTVLAAAGPAFGGTDAELYELGRRLTAVEAAWEEVVHPPGGPGRPDARKRAVDALQKVHTPFLLGDFAEAGRGLDLAAFALRSDTPPGTARQWAMSLCAFPETRVVDGTATELAVTVRPLYPVKGEVPKDLEIQLWFTDRQVHTARPGKFPYTAKVPLPPLGEFPGLDRKLYLMVETGRVIHRGPVGVSQVAKLTDRVAALKAAAGAWPALDTIERATVRDRADLLTGLVRGAFPETNLPAAELLANAETMLDGKPFFTPARPGQFWMSVPLGGKKTAPVRVYVPKGLDPKAGGGLGEPAGGSPRKRTVPVVVGLHGAGGTENVFFEAYGLGRAVAECERRGWVFVATRSRIDFLNSPPVGVILDRLAERYPIDPKRVFLVGHSMGAAHVTMLAQKHRQEGVPGEPAGGSPVKSRFAALAALGGGGAVTDPKAFAGLPVFVAAGEQDFARPAARAVHKALADGGTDVTYKDYPLTEHMLIVREALPDVFAAFDAVAVRP